VSRHCLGTERSRLEGLEAEQRNVGIARTTTTEQSVVEAERRGLNKSPRAREVDARGLTVDAVVSETGALRSQCLSSVHLSRTSADSCLKARRSENCKRVECTGGQSREREEVGRRKAEQAGRRERERGGEQVGRGSLDGW
jgi:hypothetical protein